MAGRPITLEYWLAAAERRRKELRKQEAVRPLSTDLGFSDTALKRWQREFDRRLGLLRVAESRVSALQQPLPPAGKQLTYWQSQVMAREAILADLHDTREKFILSGGWGRGDHRRYEKACDRVCQMIEHAKHKVQEWELRAKARANGAGLRRVT